MNVRVQGGTNAGWRRVLNRSKASYTCENCGARNRYYWVRCPVCSHPRPE